MTSDIKSKFDPRSLESGILGSSAKGYTPKVLFQGRKLVALNFILISISFFFWSFNEHRSCAITTY